MSENKNRFVGFRVTPSELKKMDKTRCKMNPKLSMTEFVRTAILSHMEHLENADLVLDLVKTKETLRKVKKSFMEVEKLLGID